MRTLGSQIVPARINELRRVLLDLNADDMSQLDPTIGTGMDRPLGRELLAAKLPVAESVYVCLHNLEAAGLIVLHRGPVAAQIRALAIAPDMRRKGLARSLLMAAERRVLEHNLHWLWMNVPSANIPATKCALACGFRRYRPQYLRRDAGRLTPSQALSVSLEHLDGDEVGKTITHWLGVEVTCGDAWIQPLIEAELLPLLLPSNGRVWLCIVDGQEAGCAHMAGSQSYPQITLWLDQALWNTQQEIACLTAVLTALQEVPAAMDVWLGSGGHLRASVARFKALGFRPVLSERVIFARHLQQPES